MASRRPAAPRRRSQSTPGAGSGKTGKDGAATAGRVPSGRTPSGRTPSGRSAPAGPEESPARRKDAAARPTEPAERTSPRPARRTAEPAARRGRTVGRPATPAEGEGRVVQAADRFRALVVGRPWRRRRRTILASLAGVLALLVAAAITAVYLPALQVSRVDISGLGYLDEAEVRSVVEKHDGDSVLLLRTGRIQQELEAVPGVASAEVERSWPDGVTVHVTEIAPVAVLTRSDGSTAVLGAAGEELPAAAAEGQTLVPLAVGAGATDPDGAAAAMGEVVGAIPDPLRGSIRSVTATTASDVTLELALEDGTVKTVIWGDAADSELKAEVVQALVSQPGTVIDVSSPVAPVTR